MKSIFAASAAVLALSGCASIFNGKTQAVVVNSVPDGAALTVANRAGEKVHSGTTPVTLTLNRGAGYFRSEVYTVTLSKEGFAKKEITITATLSGWYIGNILLGGVLGMVVVDPITGGMFAFPPSVTGTLEAEEAKTSRADMSLTIVSAEAFTAEQLKAARPLTKMSLAR
jgi:hypothetical protein